MIPEADDFFVDILEVKQENDEPEAGKEEYVLDWYVEDNETPELRLSEEVTMERATMTDVFNNLLKNPCSWKRNELPLMSSGLTLTTVGD